MIILSTLNDAAGILTIKIRCLPDDYTLEFPDKKSSNSDYHFQEQLEILGAMNEKQLRGVFNRVVKGWTKKFEKKNRERRWRNYEKGDNNE